MSRRLSTSQAAQRLGVTRRTLVKWVKEGRLEAFCVEGWSEKGNRYFFEEDEVEAFGARHGGSPECESEGVADSTGNRG